MANGVMGIFGVWIRPSGDRPYVVFWNDLGDRASRFLDNLKSPVESRDTIPRTLTSADATTDLLGEITDALPDELILILGRDELSRLTVMPTGVLWGIPWAALPIGSEPLIRRTILRIAPLTAAIDQKQKGEPSRSKLRVTAMIDDELLDIGDDERDELNSMIDDRRTLEGLKEVDHGDISLIISHGTPIAGLAQHVGLGDEIYSAADIVTGPAIGQVVIFLACWSTACRYGRAVEPIAFPTAALVRGARAVIGPEWALPTNSIGRLAIDLLRHPLIYVDAPAALRDVQLAALDRDPDPSTWATLACFG